MDAAPCTDVIQQIVYAPEKSQVSLNEHLRRVALPNEILKTIAIVDTPGTNTIIRHHQEITHKFIPNSDLVMFVFPAKNPHTLTSWELLDFVSEEWRRYFDEMQEGTSEDHRDVRHSDVRARMLEVTAAPSGTARRGRLPHRYPRQRSDARSDLATASTLNRSGFSRSGFGSTTDGPLDRERHTRAGRRTG